MRGFTLVELLVSAGIVALLLAVGTPTFQRFGQQAALGQAATDLVSVFTEAQSLALAPPANRPGGVLCYGIRFTQGAVLNFDLVQWRGATEEPVPCDADPVRQQVLVEHTLPRDIVLTEIPDAPIWYSIGRQGALESQGKITVELQHLRTKERRRISVNEVTGQAVRE